jgi:hypothetical protein
MNQQGDDTELKAAFAEFKELLKRESEPVGASLAPEITLEPRSFSAPARQQAKEPSSVSAKTEHFAPLRPAAPQAPRADHDVDAFGSEPLSAPVLAADAEQIRRSRLIYLSLAIVFAGLVGLGVTLVKSPGTASEPAIADIAPPEEPGTEQAALEPPAIGDEKEAAPATAETPLPAEKAEGTQTPEAPTPKAAAAERVLPLPGVPPVEDAAPATAKAGPAPKQAAAAPIAAPAAPAAGGIAQPAAKTSTAALQPATRAAEPEAPVAAEPARTETKAAAKPAEKPAKVAKPKAKPAAAQTAAKPQKPAAPAAVADRVEPPPPPAPAPAATVAAPPPPPPPSDNGGAFGFVKRTVNTVGSTVNSVGSTIGDLGRSVIP